MAAPLFVVPALRGGAPIFLPYGLDSAVGRSHGYGNSRNREAFHEDGATCGGACDDSPGRHTVPPGRPAQTGAASLTGIVTDQSGASVPGVTVTATNQSTNVVFSGVTNEAGSYTIASVPIGVYVVKTERTGFKTAATRPVAVEANQTVRLDVKLEIGLLEQTIEVSSETQVLQTENATVGEVISGTTLQTLPLNGRNAGHCRCCCRFGHAQSWIITNVQLRRRPPLGTRNRQTNNYTIDGVDMTMIATGRLAPTLTAAQISVETTTMRPTPQRAGAVSALP